MIPVIPIHTTRLLFLPQNYLLILLAKSLNREIKVLYVFDKNGEIENNILARLSSLQNVSHLIAIVEIVVQKVELNDFYECMIMVISPKYFQIPFCHI